MEKKPLTFISSVWYLQTTLLWQYIFSVKRSAAVLHCISTIKLWCSKVAVFNFNNSVQYVRFTKMGLVQKRGTAAEVPPPFRPGNPAFWELFPSHPILLYTRGLAGYTCMLYLSTVLCVCVCAYMYFVFSLFSGLFSFTGFSFSTLILLVGCFDL